jgi:iron(III) transport system permease protein
MTKRTIIPDPALAAERVGSFPGPLEQIERPRFEGRQAEGRRLDVWTLGAMVVALLVVAPLLALVYLALAPTDDIWSHLASTVLPVYVRTTFILMLGVGIGTFVIGVGTAWLVTMCRFPGSRIFQWVLLLPLAVPAYVIAYVYTDLLEFAGPIQGLLRDMFGWTTPRDYWFPQIRSLGGAIAMMTLVLYPYVYLLARAAFVEQSVCVLEVSRTLGKTPWRAFVEVALPLARPAIVVGVSLVLMETLNDFGTVDFFAVPTFTLGIYDVWLNMNSVAGAAQLALVLLLVVLVLLAAERLARRGQRYHHTSTRYRALPSYRLAGGRAWGAVCACVLPPVLGFAVPAVILAKYTLQLPAGYLGGDFLRYAWNSLSLSLIAAFLAIVIGLFLVYGVRLSRGPWLQGMVRFAGIGYAVPGAVLAVGIMIPLAALDNTVDAFSRQAFGLSTGLILSGTIFAIVYGYLVRFLALSLGTTEAGLAKITVGVDGAARTLGLGPLKTMTRVHLPMMRGSILTAAILVFVDCMKELPITILLRPFNFDTLATHVHQYASSDLLEKCAPGALAIVAVGILPVIALSMTIGRSRPGTAAAQT